MDAATLRSLALRGGGYATPRLNDSLQAHGAGLGGFLVVSGFGGGETAAGENPASPLAAYSCLKSLNLADNGFESLKGMPRLEELRCLFIERNCLSSLAGLARAAPRLSTLDASGNRVGEVEVEGESECLPGSLETLRLSGNDLSSPEALNGLFVCGSSKGGKGEAGSEERGNNKSGGSGSSSSSSPSLLPVLSTLDLSHCSISEADTVLALLRSLPALKALYLQGNPFWGSFRSCSKNSNSNGTGGTNVRLCVLAAAPFCTYLNDSPVFGDERAAADAFRESQGSLDAARAAREAFLEAAALEAEKTTRLLERPPRFVRLAEEEEGDEEADFEDDDEENRNDAEEEEKGLAKKKGVEGVAAAEAEVEAVVLVEGEDEQKREERENEKKK